MKIVRMVVGFVPFLLFTVLGYWVPVGWAAVLGLVTAVVLVVITANGGIKILPTVQAAILLLYALLGFLGGPATASFLIHYGRGTASLLLGLIIVGTAWSMPFTAQFARSAVPEQVWHTPEFLRVNTRISVAWGLAVVVVGLCHLAGSLPAVQGSGRALELLVHWAVPILAFVWALGVTKRAIPTHPAPAA